MATINTGYTFVSGEIVTPSKLNDAVNSAQVSGIVNANISATAGIVDTKLASIETPGKVANTATTATTANVPSAIVARDPNGDFTAGVITAELNGYAATAGTAGNASLANQAELALSTTNVAGGLEGQLLVQTAPDTTGFLDYGTTGRVLTSAGSGAAPTWEVAPGGLLASVVNFEYTPSTIYTGQINYGANQNFATIVAYDCDFLSNDAFNIQIVSSSIDPEYPQFFFTVDNGCYSGTLRAPHFFDVLNFSSVYSGVAAVAAVTFRIGLPVALNGGPSITRNSLTQYSYNIGSGRTGLSAMVAAQNYVGSRTANLLPPIIESIGSGGSNDVNVIAGYDSVTVQGNLNQRLYSTGMTSVVFAS